MASVPYCPSCNKAVYFAEEIRAIGQSFHKFCLKCAQCRKTLDSSSINDHQGELFCRTCYNKNFGPKGYGFASGGAGLSTEGGQGGGLYRRSISEDRQVRPTPAIYSRAGPTLLSSNNSNSSSLDRPRHNQQHITYPQTNNTNSLSRYGNENNGPVSHSRPSSVGPGSRRASTIKYGGCVDLCPTCDGPVYHNERLDCAGKVFHKLCLKCALCHRLMDTGSVNQHAGEVFCKSCYTKNFNQRVFLHWNSLAS